MVKLGQDEAWTQSTDDMERELDTSVMHISSISRSRAKQALTYYIELWDSPLHVPYYSVPKANFHPSLVSAYQNPYI